MRKLAAVACVGLLVFGIEAFSSEGTPEASTESKTVPYLLVTPSDVPAGSGWGRARVRWDAGGPARVLVSMDGKGGALFAVAAKGDKVFDFVYPGRSYEFQLYSGSTSELLARASAVGTEVVDFVPYLGPLARRAFHVWLPPALLSGALVLTAAFFSRRRHRQIARGLLAASVVTLSAAATFQVFAKPLTPLERQATDSQVYADAARNLAEGNGYVTFGDGNDPKTPQYPPGYSIALVPFHWLDADYPAGIVQGARFYAALYVVVAVVTAWAIGGWLTAAFSALFILASPFAVALGSLVLSDGLAAVLTVAAIGLLHKPTDVRVALSGALMGAAVSVRLPCVVLFGAVLALPLGKQRVRLVLAAMPFLVALAIYNWSTFGHPLATGYPERDPSWRRFALAHMVAWPVFGDGPWMFGDLLEGWLLRWACPCEKGGPQASLRSVVFYPALLAGLFWIYAPPFVTGCGLISAWRRRREEAASAVLIVTALSLVLFAAHFYQATRFMAGPCTLLLIFGARAMSDCLGKKNVGGRGGFLPPTIGGSEYSPPAVTER